MHLDQQGLLGQLGLLVHKRSNKRLHNKGRGKSSSLISFKVPCIKRKDMINNPEDYASFQQIPTSPTLPVDSGIVRSPKAFSDGLTLDLTDDEIKRALQIVMPIKNKWHAIFVSKFRDKPLTAKEAHTQAEAAMKLVDQFEDELVTTLAERMNLIVSVDVLPVLESGQPPIIDFIGALPGHYSASYGFDHERKRHEVLLAEKRGESFLGSSKLDI